MERLKEIWKRHHKEIVLFILIFLISTISFGLGYIVANEYNRTPIIIEKNSDIEK